MSSGSLHHHHQEQLVRIPMILAPPPEILQMMSSSGVFQAEAKRYLNMILQYLYRCTLQTKPIESTLKIPEVVFYSTVLVTFHHCTQCKDMSFQQFQLPAYCYL